MLGRPHIDMEFMCIRSVEAKNSEAAAGMKIQRSKKIRRCSLNKRGRRCSTVEKNKVVMKRPDHGLSRKKSCLYRKGCKSVHVFIKGYHWCAEVICSIRTNYIQTLLKYVWNF